MGKIEATKKNYMYYPVDTLGYLIHEDKKGYHVALSVGVEDSDSNARMFIPRGMVTKKRFIKI